MPAKPGAEKGPGLHRRKLQKNLVPDVTSATLMVMPVTSKAPVVSAAHGVVRIPKLLDERLSRVADRTGRAKTYYATKAITRYLEDMEDHLLAAAALEDMKAKGKTRGKSLDAVARKLGLAGEL